MPVVPLIGLQERLASAASTVNAAAWRNSVTPQQLGEVVLVIDEAAGRIALLEEALADRNKLLIECADLFDISTRPERYREMTVGEAYLQMVSLERRCRSSAQALAETEVGGE